MRGAWMVALLIALSVAPAWATELRSGNTVVVEAGETIDDDLMAFGNRVTIAGRVKGDVLAFGQRVEITGPVAGSVMAAGQYVVVTGDVAGSVRAAGREVTVASQVGRNADLAAQTVSLPETARVARDLHAAGNTTMVAGTVDRRAWLAANAATVTGATGQRVYFNGRQLTLGPGAVIGGDVFSRSRLRPRIESGATVRGQVRYQALPVRRRGLPIWRSLLWFLWVYAFGAVGLALVPRVFAAAGYALPSRPWWSLLLGLIGLVVTPAIALVLMFTVVGIPIAVFGLFLWGFAILLAGVPVGIFIGDRLLTRPGVPRPSPYLALLVGLVVLALLGLVPILGFLVILCTVLFGLGLLARATKGWLAESRRPRAPGWAS